MIEIIENDEENINKIESRKSYFKIDDNKKMIEGNSLQITEILNDPDLGTASKIWDCGIILAKYLHHNWAVVKASIKNNHVGS